MKIKEAAKISGLTELYLRHWIYSDKCPFGFWIQFPGSSRKTPKINEEAFWKWKRGELCGKQSSSESF